MKKMKEFVLALPFHTFVKTAVTRDNINEFVDSPINNKKLTGASRILFITALLLMLFPIMIAAQAVSGVTGVVTDTTGAVVPGVNVVLTDTKTATQLTTKTNEQGTYLFANVAPGQAYQLTFTIQGFQTLTVSNVTLGVARTETYDARLTPGEVAATVDVTVSGTGETINTTDASIGNIIDTRQLRELPIQIRSSPAALIGLQPGVVGNNVGQALRTESVQLRVQEPTREISPLTELTQTIKQPGRLFLQ